MKLSEMTWPEVESLDRNIVVLYPIAALEQHSRHLPFFTDTILCEAVAAQIEKAIPKDVLLLPVQWLGASTHHLGMAGTLSAETATFMKMICEPLQCLLQHGFKRIFVLNGHGGNVDGFHLALRDLARQFPMTLLFGASYWDVAEKEIAGLLQGKLKHVGHACEFETAMMLHLRPDLVRVSEIANDQVAATPPELSRVFAPLDMKRHTTQGGNGESVLATAATGEQLLKAVVTRAIEAVRSVRTLPLPVP
ncbi:MAG TPA: creatininase family protein [Verrucomicrobiae bacterium]|nr:creatininase family protein [Verrucomicrobiae bacterium]